MGEDSLAQMIAVGDDTSRSDRENVPTYYMQSFTCLAGAVTKTSNMSTESPGGPEHAGWHAHQAVRTYELYDQPDEALSIKTRTIKGRGSRGPSVWMKYVNSSSGILLQNSHRPPPDLVWHHRGTA